MSDVGVSITLGFPNVEVRHQTLLLVLSLTIEQQIHLYNRLNYVPTGSDFPSVSSSSVPQLRTIVMHSPSSTPPCTSLPLLRATSKL